MPNPHRIPKTYIAIALAILLPAVGILFAVNTAFNRPLQNTESVVKNALNKNNQSSELSKAQSSAGSKSALATTSYKKEYLTGKITGFDSHIVLETQASGESNAKMVYDTISKTVLELAGKQQDKKPLELKEKSDNNGSPVVLSLVKCAEVCAYKGSLYKENTDPVTIELTKSDEFKLEDFFEKEKEIKKPELASLSIPKNCPDSRDVQFSDQVYTVSSSQKIYESYCTINNFQKLYGYSLWDSQSGQSKTLSFESYISDQKNIGKTSQICSSGNSFEAGVLKTFCKSREAGDCGIISEYKWNAFSSQFETTKIRLQEQCELDGLTDDQKKVHQIEYDQWSIVLEKK